MIERKGRITGFRTRYTMANLPIHTPRRDCLHSQCPKIAKRQGSKKKKMKQKKKWDPGKRVKPKHNKEEQVWGYFWNKSFFSSSSYTEHFTFLFAIIWISASSIESFTSSFCRSIVNERVKIKTKKILSCSWQIHHQTHLRMRANSFAIVVPKKKNGLISCSSMKVKFFRIIRNDWSPVILSL